MSEEEVYRLTQELFSAVEEAQGYAYCSDGETFKTMPEFFARIRGRLEWNKRATRIMSEFLRKHRQLHEPAADPAAPGAEE